MNTELITTASKILSDEMYKAVFDADRARDADRVISRDALLNCTKIAIPLPDMVGIRRAGAILCTKRYNDREKPEEALAYDSLVILNINETASTNTYFSIIHRENISGITVSGLELSIHFLGSVSVVKFGQNDRDNIFKIAMGIMSWVNPM